MFLNREDNNGTNKDNFFERFEADIVSGKKTITIRDKSENNFVKNTIVSVATFETGREFCQIRIKDVQAIERYQLNDFHAQQENMTLKKLNQVIDEIYPGVKSLYVISYERL
ncbi:N(4)-acetylcytidine aminohydrolase [Psychromonas sp. KJ10-10]|uniref:N(4)-acetylcytidine aminohydrolase n=1 Tax=Psychromonas sp. KJ10-10 TaxID=3391823 RepID=UPI0039B58EC1